MGEMQIGERAMEDLLKLGLRGQWKDSVQTIECRHGEGEPISYILAAVT